MYEIAKKIAIVVCVLIPCGLQSMERPPQNSNKNLCIWFLQAVNRVTTRLQHERSNTKYAMITPLGLISQFITGTLALYAAYTKSDLKYVVGLTGAMALCGATSITFIPAHDRRLLNLYFEKDTLTEKEIASIKKLALRLNSKTISGQYFTYLAFSLIYRGRDYHDLQDLKILIHVIKHGADIHAKDPYKDNTLLLACCKYIQNQQDLPQIVTFLLNKKADTTVSNFKTLNACLQILFRKDHEFKTFKLLLDHELTHNCPPNLNTYLAAAAAKNNLKAAIHLLNCGAAIDALTNGYTPLQWACDHSHERIVQYLLYRGADKAIIATHDDEPTTALEMTPDDEVEIRQMLESPKRPPLSDYARKLELELALEGKTQTTKLLKNREMGLRRK